MEQGSELQVTWVDMLARCGYKLGYRRWMGRKEEYGRRAAGQVLNLYPSSLKTRLSFLFILHPQTRDSFFS